MPPDFAVVVAAARLGERANAAKVRDQRFYRCERRRIEVARLAFEVATLAHCFLRRLPANRTGAVVNSILPSAADRRTGQGTGQGTGQTGHS
jgi:hypothetical protein